MRWRLALLNTFRNRRRTALNLLMIAGGVVSVLLFEGFAANVLRSLRETTIQTQTGHLQIANSVYWNQTYERPREKLMDNHEEIVKDLSRDSAVAYASGRIDFFGLLSKGEKSLSARGMSFDPRVESQRNASFQFVDGKPLHPDQPYTIVLGTGLASRLGVKVGDSLVVLSNTYDGVINALDVTVGGVFQTGIADFDNVTFLISLQASQTLLDTQKVERIVVGLKSTDSTELFYEGVKNRFAGVEVRTWKSVATLYRQLASFNGVQNRVIEFIILALTFFAILNTVGMSIFERTGEIGTVRAMGETRRTVVWQFLMEGWVLGVMGSGLGVLFGVVISTIINLSGIELTMPGASMPLTIKIDLVATSFGWAVGLAWFAAAVAAWVPALRASRMNIATALRQNI